MDGIFGYQDLFEALFPDKAKRYLIEPIVEENPNV